MIRNFKLCHLSGRLNTMGKRSRAMAYVKTTRNGDKQFDKIRKKKVKVFVLVNTIGCIIQYNEEPKSENKFSFFLISIICVLC